MKYVGITIGPIFDTVNDATRPAALWFASTMFSDITRRLCIEINEKFALKSNQLLSPFYDNKDSSGLEDGVGKYHDRIIFSTDKDDNEEIKKILDDVISGEKEKTVNIFGGGFLKPEDEKKKAAEFFENYLMIGYVILDEEKIKGKSCLLAISPYLDDLEIMYFSPNGNENSPIKKLFAGEKDDPNKLIKESALYNKLSDEGINNICERCKDGTKNENRVIKSIEYIAGRNIKSEYKRTNYFAVVSADGDKMGDFLKTIENSSITKFSEACLKYDKEAAQKVVDFGGMPIYAGGDDLLFLAPVIGKDGETVLKLCSEIKELFTEKVKNLFTEDKEEPSTENAKELSAENEKDKCEKKDVIPTISFGISIQYYKYPLYEALNRARGQLELAKHVKEGEDKNRTSVVLEKHSGQTVSFIIGNERIASFENDFLKYTIKKDKNEKAEDENADNKNESVSEEFILQSLGSKLELHRKLVEQIDKRQGNLKLDDNTDHYPWDNLFDNEGQKYAQEYLHYIQQWYYNEVKGENWRVETNDEITFLQAALRMRKFLIERGQD
jgi:CRISPR-associated protein Cmr2